ncbi:MAG: glycosyltransferase family 2 protein, partial [Thermomicrobiales bacterium]|nr:glycosyltransferase family 2 protein [Thermomicrobiales bacterium]
MTPDLSIVVVHWNVPTLLDGCLRSIAEECAATPEIATETLVVDCASPNDDHQSVVSRYPGVSLIELPENRGYAAGCNAGISASSGRLVLLLNPDIVLEAGAIAQLCRAFDIADHIGMTAPLLRNADGSLQSAGYAFPRPHHLLFNLLPVSGRLIESPLNGRTPVGDGKLPIRIDYPLGAAMCVRRRAINDVGLLDEGYGMYSEEIDWARRFADHNWTTMLI